MRRRILLLLTLVAVAVPVTAGSAAPPARRAADAATARAYERLDPLFAPFGMDPGRRVNAGDVYRLGREVGVPMSWPPTARAARRVAYRATRRAADPYPATLRWGGIVLRLPSTGVEMIGFHQSNHEGARNTTVAHRTVRWSVLGSRGRRAGRRSAADIVVGPGVDIVAPVSGRVVRAGTYTLYCRHSDDYVVIEPEGRPGIEVKMLHVDGVRVRAGQRVVAGSTVLAGGPTPLPFGSQVDRRSHWRDWPHVHLEVVDTSIPDVSNGGSGSGC